MQKVFKISSQYTKTPGGRTKNEGAYSGEEFREKHLKPLFLDAKQSGDEVVVDFDGGYGYGYSFLEEAFGGLVRELKDPGIQKIVLVSNEEPTIIQKVTKIIKKELERN